VIARIGLSHKDTLFPGCTMPTGASLENSPPVSSGSTVNISVVRMLRVLDLFTRGATAHGVTEVSRQLGISKNMAFRALSALTEHGYLVRDASGSRYHLGYRILGFRKPNAPEEDVRGLVFATMQVMQALTGESVSYGVAMGGHFITIDGIEGRGVRVSRISWGGKIPLHVTPSARVILAFLGDAEIDAYIERASPLQRFTEYTITDPVLLWAEITAIRQRGYARSFQDYAHFDADYIAFPILDAEGLPHGALTVGGPRERFTEARVQALLPRMSALVRELNERTRLIPAGAIFIGEAAEGR